MRTKYANGFESLNNETEINRLDITGKIPEWITGSLIRTAPSKFETNKQNLNHWFDGFAMLHQFSFENGQVGYRNKFVKSNAYKEFKNNGELKLSEFATDPCESIFAKIKSFFTPPKATDNPNVNTGMIGKYAVAMTETPMPVIFDEDTLKTVGHLKFKDDLKGLLTVAHPHFDPDGTMYSYLLEFGYKSKYRVFQVPFKGTERELIATISSKEPGYIHSFGMTENYIILAEFPFAVNPLKLKFSDKPLIANYKWKPELGTKFHIINKNTRKLESTIKSEAFFCFHHVNAYEKFGQIIVDLIAFDDAQVIQDFYLDNLRNDEVYATGNLRRYTLDPSKELILSEELSESKMGLPRIDYDFNGIDYNRMYAVGTQTPGNFYDSLVTRDMKTGKEDWWYEEGCYPGEPVLIKKDKKEAVVLSVVFDSETAKSFLLILDAHTFKEIGRAQLPQHVPFGFHGNYFE